MVFTNLQPFPHAMTPLTNISPLTYRDGITFLEKLERMRQWLNEIMVPDINAALANAIDEFQTGIENAEQTVLTAKAGWQATFNQFSSELNASFETFKNATNEIISEAQTDITAQKAEWQTLFDQFMANVEAEIVALNDSAVASMLSDSETLTGAAFEQTTLDIAGNDPADYVIYVSPRGDDNNAGGTPGRAKKTIQAALNAIESAGGGTVFAATGTYVEDIVIGKRTSLIGRRVTIKSPPGSTALGVVTIKPGPVFNVTLEGLLIDTENAGQHGLYFHAQSIPGDPANNGGFWWSNLKSLRFNVIDGDLIWLRGGGVDHLKPHQFILMHDIVGFAPLNRSALRMSGQVGQVDIYGGEFDGKAINSADTAPAVLLQREISDVGAVLSDVAPYTINFHGTTIQTKKRGITNSRGRGITLYGCYFENIGQGIAVEASGQLSANATRFANVGQVGDGTGYCAHQSSGELYLTDCEIQGAVAEATYKGNPDTGHLALNNSPVPSTLPASTGRTSQIAVSGAGVLTVAGQKKTTMVTTSATPIVTITSGLPVGETLYIRPTGGTIVLATGGNISGGGNALPFTVPAGVIVGLTRWDFPTNQFHITSVSNAT